MRTVSVRFIDLQVMKINLGFVGENEHTRVLIDCKKAFDQYPGAFPSLTVKPPQGDPYPAVVSRDGDIVSWNVTNSDLVYDGEGEIQLSFIQDNVVMKTFKGRTVIGKSILPSGETPAPIQNFIDEANRALAEIPTTIDNALQEAKDSGEFDGFSPTVNIENIDGGHSVTITSVEGSNTFNVMDGEQGPKGDDGQDGHDGQDGFSPTVSVVTVADGHVVNITDKAGLRTFEVLDGRDGTNGVDGAPGRDGANGQDGSDGVSPVVSVQDIDKGHRITITDATGAHTFDVINGTGVVNKIARAPVSIGIASVTFNEGADGEGINDDFCVHMETVDNNGSVYYPSDLTEKSFSTCNILHEYGDPDSPSNDMYNINFPAAAGAVYSATIYPLKGKLYVTGVMLTLNTANMDYDIDNDSEYATPGWQNTGAQALIGETYTTISLSNIGYGCVASTWGDDDIIMLPRQTFGMTGQELINRAIDVQVVLPLEQPIEYDFTPIEISTKQGFNRIEVSKNNLYYDAVNVDFSFTYVADLELFKFEDYATKTDTVLNTTLSINRNEYAKIGEHSVAIGQHPEASGENSLALGCYTVASGNNSVALGYYSRATTDESFAGGAQTTVNGRYGFAYGYGSTAQGIASVAHGYYPRAEGNYSTAIGYYTTASGEASTALGNITTASAYASVAIGSSTIASGHSSFAGGNGSSASGSYSIAFGNNASADGLQSAAFNSAYAYAPYSFAAGQGTNARGNSSATFGYGTESIGYCSAAFGNSTMSAASGSLSAGYGTIAGQDFSMAVGVYNVAGGIYDFDEWASGNSYDVGDKVKITRTLDDGQKTVDAYVCVTPNTQEEFVDHEWDEQIQDWITYWDYTYIPNEEQNLFIVGNGEGNLERSNALTVKRSGDVYVNGNIYVNSDANGSGGSPVIKLSDIWVGGPNSVGQFALAIGMGTRALGGGSFAGGAGATASGSSSFAFGGGSQAVGNNSFAFGGGAYAIGYNSFALGGGTSAYGEWSIAGGAGSKSYGNGSVALGNAVQAYGDSTFVVGQENFLDQRQADEWTPNTHYDVDDVVKIATNNSFYSCVFAHTSPEEFSTQDDQHTLWEHIDGSEFGYLFAVGNGTDDNHRSNALSVDKNGNGHFMGDVYANCLEDGTGGSKLAKTYDAEFENSISMGRAQGTTIGYHSVALGSGVEASSGYAVALGSGSIASGYYAIAAGNSAQATYSGSIAIGTSASASGYNSFALGVYSEAHNNCSFALGYYANVTKDNSYAIGNYPIADGYNSYAIGDYAKTEGRHSFSVGNGTITAAEDSFAIGNYNVADGVDVYPEWIAGHTYHPGDRVKVTTYYTTDGGEEYIGDITAYECLVEITQDTFGTGEYVSPGEWVDYWDYVERTNYVLMVGNGYSAYDYDTGEEATYRSNAFTVGWDGSGRFGGDLYVNCNNDSTGGSKLISVVDVASIQETQSIIDEYEVTSA